MQLKQMLIVVAAAMSSASASPDTSNATGHLAWMSGDWISETPHGWIEEHWSAARGGALIGYSRSGKGEKLREFEFLRIATNTDGVPIYWAQPGGRPAVGFALSAAATQEATFENPQHDFPTRINYRRTDDTLTATISGPNGANAQSWTYRRSGVRPL